MVTGRPFGGVASPASEPDEPISAEPEAESIEAALDVIEAEAASRRPRSSRTPVDRRLRVAGEPVREEPPPETVGGESDNAR